MKPAYYIDRQNLKDFLKTLSKEFGVYIPNKINQNRYFRRLNEETLENIILNEVRSTEPVKSFFVPARELIARYFNKFEDTSKSELPIAIVGLKSCDLASFKIMDYVFSNTLFEDPTYAENKKNSLIISSDCTSYGKSCFCVALNIEPYPTQDYDINLSELNGGYLVKIATKKGEDLVRKSFELFRETVDDEERLCNLNREKLSKDLKDYIKDFKIPPTEFLQGHIKRKFDSSIWEELSKTCVECGACNIICPTCHCFLLLDQKKGDGFEKLRAWDSCLLLGFARVAGGANPRKLLNQRLRNRMDKKFNFFPAVAGAFACTGCGRCIDACPGKIDIREILKRLGE